MAVSIPIQASATGAVDAIKQIQDAIERAGQAGRKFADLDLGHKELAPMAEDIRRLQRRLEDLARVGRGSTSAAYRGVMRAAGGEAGDPLAWEHSLDRVFPDPAERARHRSSVLSWATQGTRWQPPAGGGGGGPGGAGGGGGGGPGPVPGGGGGGPAPAVPLSSMAAVAMGNLASAGIQFALSTAKEFAVRSIGLGRDEATGNEDLYRHTDTAKSFDELRDAIMATTKGLGVTAQEAQQLALSFAKVTGANDADVISAGTRQGIGFGRAFGIGPQAGVQAMSQATVAGLDPAKFAALVGEAASKGGRSADETIGAVLRLADAAAKSLVTHTNSMESASMLAGLNAMGLPGFRGANAEAVMSTLNTSLAHPGGGVAGQAFMFRALQAQGVTDPYQQQYLAEGGLFASAKADLGHGTSTSMFDAVRQEIMRQYPGDSEAMRYRRANAMSNLDGLNMRQNMELLRYKPADLSTTFGALQSAHVDLQSMNPTSIADAVRISNAAPGDLEGLRQGMLGRHGQGELTDEDKATLSSADPNSLRGVLLQMSSKYGQSETEGSKTRDAMADLSNKLTELGRGLIGPLNDLKDVEGKLVEGVTGLTETLADVYKAARGDSDAQDRLMFGKGGARAGGGEAPLTGAAADAMAGHLMDFFQSEAGGGWSKEQAAGLAANAMAESGGRAHGPAGDNGQARGLYQWHPDRVAAIEAHARAAGWEHTKLDDMTWQEQAQAKAWELSPEGPEAAAGQALRGTRTAYGAGYTDTVMDQRPAQAPMRGVNRGTLAMSIANQPRVEGSVTVIHVDPSGNQLHQQQLPITDVGTPTPYGPRRPNDAAPAPPPPPRLNWGSQFWNMAP